VGAAGLERQRLGFESRAALGLCRAALERVPIEGRERAGLKQERRPAFARLPTLDRATYRRLSRRYSVTLRGLFELFELWARAAPEQVAG